MCKGITRINNGTFKRQSLTFMNRNSPSQPNRILAKYSRYFFCNFFRLLVQYVFIIPPFFLQQLKLMFAILSTYKHTRFVDSHHFSNHTVIIPFFRRNIILEEHDLRPLLNSENFIRRIGIFGEIVFHFSTETVSLPGQRSQLTVIDPLCLIIMCRQTDITFFFWGLKISLIPFVQLIQDFIIRFILPYLIQQGKKKSITLTIYLFQFNRHISSFPQRTASKEIGCFVIMPQHLPLAVFHNGRQLLQISNHQQLYPAEWFLTVTITPQSRIHRIQQIRTYHTDFINHKQIHAPNDVTFLLINTVVYLCRVKSGIRHERRKRQLKERMDCYSARIDSRNTRRRQNNHAFRTLFS